MKRKVAFVLVALYFVGVLVNLIVDILVPDPELGFSAVLASLLAVVLSGAVGVLLLLRSIRQGPARFMGWRAVAASALNVFAVAWIIGFGLLNVAISINIFYKAPDVWEGIATWHETYSPSLGNGIIMLVLVAPALGASSLAKRLVEDRR